MAKYIDADALYYALMRLCGKFNMSFGEESIGFGKELAEISDKLPAMDVRRERHGKWSDKMVAVKETAVGYHEDDMRFGFRCSKCGEVLNKTPYCGNCGAKMDGEENENG